MNTDTPPIILTAIAELLQEDLTYPIQIKYNTLYRRHQITIEAKDLFTLIYSKRTARMCLRKHKHKLGTYYTYYHIEDPNLIEQIKSTINRHI